MTLQKDEPKAKPVDGDGESISRNPELAEAEFVALADNLPVLCWMAYADGHIFWYNRGWYEYTGTSPETQEGWGWESVHDPRYLHLVLDRWKTSIATGAPFEMTFPLKGADGHFRPFLTRIVPRRDEHGVIRRWYGTNVDISAQVAAEDALRTSEARFRSFAEAMPNHVWTATADGSLDWFNSTVYQYSGASEGELDGDGWAKLVHPDDLPLTAKNWQAALAAGKSYETEFRLRRHDGDYRWFIARATPICDALGSIAQWIGTNTDIEDQKRAVQALTDNERRLVLSQKAAGIASLELDIATGTVIGSEGFWDLWGLSPRDSVHISVLENIVLAEDAHIRSREETRLNGTAIPVVEYRVRRVDNGQLRWLWRAVDFVRDAYGTPIKMYGVIQDITDRKAIELSLRESEARYRGALSVGRIGSWETDLVTRTRRWSPEAEALFGLSLSNGVGYVGGERDEYESALHPDDRHLVAKFHELADKVDSFDAEYRVVRPDGTIIWLSGRGQVFERGNDGRCKRLINIVADVTEQKRNAEHVRFLLREMSHRSKNLLAIIQGIARQTARRSGSIDEFQRRFGERLHGLSASHDILVEQSWRTVPFAELVRRQLAAFVSADSQRLELSGADLNLNARAAQAIGLALHELATNAVKYGALSGARGKVSVSWSVDHEPADGPAVVLRWIESGGPLVTPPARIGFGSEVISRIAPSSISGTSDIEYAPTGLRYILTFPLSILAVAEVDDVARAF